MNEPKDIPEKPEGTPRDPMRIGDLLSEVVAEIDANQESAEVTAARVALAEILDYTRARSASQAEIDAARKRLNDALGQTGGTKPID